MLELSLKRRKVTVPRLAPSARIALAPNLASPLPRQLSARRDGRQVRSLIHNSPMDGKLKQRSFHLNSLSMFDVSGLWASVPRS
jgi:hypothetical protein